MTPTHLASRLDVDRLDIDGEAYRHLFRARRMAVGDSLRVVDGAGRARRGVVAAIDRRRASIELGEDIDTHEPRRRVHLVVGALRPERAGWLVEKATELGADRITFIGTERTPRDYGAGRLDRLRRMAASAVEQCGRSWCPPIDGVVDWDDALERLAGEAGIVLQPDAPPLADRWAAGASLRVWIGPEGGFSTSETSELIGRGVEAVGLGPSILRVETASVAAAALLLCGTFSARPTESAEQ